MIFQELRGSPETEIAKEGLDACRKVNSRCLQDDTDTEDHTTSNPLGYGECCTKGRKLEKKNHFAYSEATVKRSVFYAHILVYCLSNRSQQR
ncbi:hypothetical protein AV530_007838 [Patagioenas fasciata monilis]|uniref:Uncharacterized protein n=1 Tax=Patagioenas fasciata monilis TaxID=372326 RepID=A0A1V4JUG9_PATFA|nr:hypothetical protein AV530_007838 [Patagioenas fasciata monilis]